VVTDPDVPFAVSPRNEVAVDNEPIVLFVQLAKSRTIENKENIITFLIIIYPLIINLFLLREASIEHLLNLKLHPERSASAAKDWRENCVKRA
jgi:hypothetical protein